MKIVAAIFVIFFFTWSTPVFSDSVDIDDTDLEIDLNFKIEEVEKKPWSVNADVEILETAKFIDSNTLLFKQKYLNQNRDDVFFQTDLNLTFEGEYHWETFSIHGRLKNESFYNEDVSLESEAIVQETFVSFQPSASLAVNAGKKVYKWGKGYAFSPSSFFARPKDIDDPDASLEGYWAFSIDYIKSNNSIFKTVAVTPVIMPVTDNLNDEVGNKNELIWGGKIYLLTYDTDIDFVFMASDNLGNRFGADFSKNLSPEFEIHGEAAMMLDQVKRIIDQNGSTAVQENTTYSFLAGLRWLTELQTTYILEYYHNGNGYTENQYENYFTLIETGYDQFVSSGSKTFISKSKQYASHYNQQTPMKDYIYLKISQKDPFDILYFSPYIACIYNINDQSAMITSGMTYSPITNLTLGLKTAFLIGNERTEYGEKMNSAKLEISVKYYF